MFGFDVPPKVNDVPRATLARDAFDPRRGITWMVVPATVRPCWVSEPGKIACQLRLRRSWLVNAKLQTPLESVSVPVRVIRRPYLTVLVVVGAVTFRLVASGFGTTGVNVASAVASKSALGEPSPVAGS